MTHFRASPALRAAFALGLALPLWLAACHQAPEEHKAQEDKKVVVPVPASTGADNRIAPVDTSAPVNAAAALSPEEMKGKKGARLVLSRWADALQRGDWATARAQWGHGGSDSGLDPEAFVRAYQKYQRLKVTYGDGDTDGGAGSIYYQVPVTIYGTLRDGRVVHLVGPVTLRRVNDVDGATPDELAWHISQSDLKKRP